MADRIYLTDSIRELAAWVETWGPHTVTQIVEAHPAPAATTIDRLLKASRLGVLEITDRGWVRLP